MLGKMSDTNLKISDLPMNGETIHMDRKSILGGPLAEAFKQDEDGWCLFFIKSGIVAHDNVVEDYVDIWNFMTMEWCNEGISGCIQVALGDHELDDITDLNRLFLKVLELVLLRGLGFLWLVIIAALHLDLKCRRASTLDSDVLLPL